MRLIAIKYFNRLTALINTHSVLPHRLSSSLVTVGLTSCIVCHVMQKFDNKPIIIVVVVIVEL